MRATGRPAARARSASTVRCRTEPSETAVVPRQAATGPKRWTWTSGGLAIVESPSFELKAVDASLPPERPRIRPVNRRRSAHALPALRLRLPGQPRHAVAGARRCGQRLGALKEAGQREDRIHRPL